MDESFCPREEDVSYSLQNHCLQGKETNLSWFKKGGVVEEQCCEIIQQIDAIANSQGAQVSLYFSFWTVFLCLSMSLHGLGVGWPHRTNTHHSCILEPSGKELFLVTDQPINWLHLVPYPSLAVSFGPGVMSSRANLATSTCSLWGWRGKNFPEEEILRQKDREWGSLWCRGGRRAEDHRGIRRCFTFPLEETCINGPTVCVQKDFEALGTEFCRWKLIVHLVFLT